MTKYANENTITMKRLHKDLAKLLTEGLMDPAFNVPESVLDFYHSRILKISTIQEDENNTDIIYDINNQLKIEHSNFLALYSAVLNGLFEDNGIVLQNYGTLLVKSLNIFAKFIK